MVCKLKMALSLAMVFILLFVSPALSSGYSLPSIKSWCAQLPNSESCKYYLAHNAKHGFPIKEKSDLLRSSLEVALDHAVVARDRTYALGQRCRSQLERAAWADCVELHDTIVIKLNQTLDPTIKSTAADVQTWLSTALTNIQTCREGFFDLRVTDNVMPLIFKNDLAELISNCLALNVEYFRGEAAKKDGIFPTGSSGVHRKLLQSSSPASQANIVVAQDGSGNYKTVTEAIAAASTRRGNERFVIYVKAGTYVEDIIIKSNSITLVGDGIGKTIITGSKSAGQGTATFSTATVAVEGNGFFARGITFRNTAGPQNHQAVAFLSDSDHSAYYQCSFEGYQDTLYVRSGKQFYRECDIYGTVDFIFGNAAAVFQNCNIYARNPPEKTNTITAQGRTNATEPTGIIIHNCTVKAAADLAPVQSSVKTYLGRPWREYSRTVYIKTFLDSLIDPEGWLPWNTDLNTLYYGEYMNTGAGSSTANRVKWPGFHNITSVEEASSFTAGNFLSVDSWLPAFNIPYNPGL